ncbi:MAG TPA: hypothetical protein VJZ71_14590 [Phycisphaerae bacterium]|nr:hypothetical protein [Phycisphaerae bacterium]
MPLRRVFSIIVLISSLSGCAAPIQSPDLGELYRRAAREHDEERHPVIVIPGILGSKLTQGGTDRIVWGAFAGGYADPRTPDGARLFALPMQKDYDLSNLRDDVVPNGVLDRVRLNLLGLPLELNAYVNILATLGVGGYRDELLGKAGAIDYGQDHYTCFQFDYDWRRDNVENARRLHDFIRERRGYVEEALNRRYGRKPREVKFDIVAHSMGGLIARYFLQYGNADLPADGAAPLITWAGAKYVRRAIIIGTPNAGSAEALKELVDGAHFGPTLPTYEPAVLGTMPSVYQLLPRSRHGALVDAADSSKTYDMFDPALWEKMGWGLASRKQARVLENLLPEIADADARRSIALDHQTKCLRRAAAFHAALDAPAKPPSGLSLLLYAGDAVPTLAALSVDTQSGKLRDALWAEGDGTVLRTSALMDERVGRTWTAGLVSPIRWTQVTFLLANHLGMTKDPIFSDNVLFTLLEDRG